MIQTKKVIFLAALALALTSSPAFAGEKAPQKVVDLANTTLVNLGTDPIIVQAVKEENDKKKTLEQIKALDTKWQATPGIVDYMQALMDSPCGKHLKELQKSKPFYAEMFVMDNLGGNVCMTDKTSDYWQGDEPKFTESYKGGQGAVHISDVKFDDSTQAYLVQVSVPVKDGGTTIGAITIGVDVDKIE
jgi:hypothetical protein